MDNIKDYLCYWEVQRSINQSNKYNKTKFQQKQNLNSIKMNKFIKINQIETFSLI